MNSKQSETTYNLLINLPILETDFEQLKFDHIDEDPKWTSRIKFG